MPPLSILIKPASSACNLRCAYCFYADEASIRAVPNYGLMSQAVSHALIEKAAGAAEGSITFLFQGGEPTLAGLDFYRDFVSHVKKTVPSALAVQYANPAIKSGWSTTSRYYDTKDQEYLSLELEEGWHTLLVKANDGLVYYYLDNLQIASVEFSESALTPAWLALNAQNYGTDYEVCFDSCYLYNGGYSVYKASQESRERAEDRKAERYQQKRDNWRERHTVYKFDGSDREYTREEAKQAGLDPDHAVSSRLDREMPDSYWNY